MLNKFDDLNFNINLFNFGKNKKKKISFKQKHIHKIYFSIYIYLQRLYSFHYIAYYVLIAHNLCFNATLNALEVGMPTNIGKA